MLLIYLLLSLTTAQNITDTLSVNGRNFNLKPGPHAAQFWQDVTLEGEICHCASWAECSYGCYQNVTMWERLTKKWILVTPY